LKRIIEVVVTCKSSENICSSSGGFQEKRKTGVTQKTIQIKIEWFSEFHPVFLFYVLLSQVKKKYHPVYDQTQGTGAAFS